MANSRRFLAPGGRSGDGHGYLNQPQRPLPQVADQSDTVDRIAEARALCDEPEAPSSMWVDARADRAYMINVQKRMAEINQAQRVRPALSLEQRMADAKRRSRLQKIDIRAEVTAVRRMLDVARTENDRRRAKTEAAALRRLERVELRLDQPPA